MSRGGVRRAKPASVDSVLVVRRQDRESVCMVEAERLPVGVSYSRRYRCYRAYKDVGSKQVAHGLFEDAGEAIRAREQWDVMFRREGSRAVAMAVAAGRPGYQRKLQLAPKVRDRRRELRRLRSVFFLASRLLAERVTKRRTVLSAADRARLGRVVGVIMAHVEYMGYTGDVLLDDVQAAMRQEAARLAGEDCL